MSISFDAQPKTVQILRQLLWKAGYRPVPVKTGSKVPHGMNWIERGRKNPPESTTVLPTQDAMSTGILCDGLRVLDIDIADQDIARLVLHAAEDRLGSAPIRYRNGTGKIALFYRAEEGEPGKVALSGSAGKLEVLGRGQQIVVLGIHPEGMPYLMTGLGIEDSGLLSDVKVQNLRAVSEEQVTRFLQDMRALIGATNPEAAPKQPSTTQSSSLHSVPLSPGISEKDRQRYTAGARKALFEECFKLAAMAKDSGRNDALNATAYRLGRFIKAGALQKSEVEQALLEACRSNGLLEEDGQNQCLSTIRSGIDSGIAAGPPELADRPFPMSVADHTVQAEIEWQDPKEMAPSLLPVPPFDLDYLPERIAPWVKDTADQMSIPMEFIAVPAIVALGSVIGSKIGIKPEEFAEWIEVPNLWGCIVGRPAVLKSPAMNAALQPLRRLEAKSREKFTAEKIEYDRQMEIFKLRKDVAKEKARKAIAGGGDGIEELDIGDEPEAPRLRRYIVQNVTYEALGVIASENPTGVLMVRDELVSLLIPLGQDENAPARGYFLEAWNGTSSYQFNRIGRGETRIETACLSMIGGTQPGVLASYLQMAVKGGHLDDGFAQRLLLLVWPDMTPKWHKPSRLVERDQQDAAYAVFQMLDDLEPSCISAQRQKFGGIWFLQYDAKAQIHFDRWRANLEERVRSDGMPPYLISHIGKYRKLVNALALINHLVDVGSGPVGEKAILRALAMAEYLEAHAKRCYGAAHVTHVETAKAILKRIRKGDLTDDFSVRDIQRNGWTGLTDHNLIVSGLDVLTTHYWLSEVEYTTRGRSKTRYRINPKAMSVP